MKITNKKALGLVTGIATLAVNLVATATGANAATITGCGDEPVGGTLTNEGSYCQLVFDTAGSHDWTLPTGISGLTALLVGGGGGSGPGYGTSTGQGWGYGGNGGDVVYSDLSSEPAGTVVTSVVGDGGVAAAGTTAATAGGSSTVSVASSIVKEAVGGIGDSGYGGNYTGAYYGYYGDGGGVNGNSSTYAGLNPKNDSSAPTIFKNLDYEYGRGGIVYQDTAGAQTIGQGGSVTAIADFSELQGNGTAGIVIYRYAVIDSAITLTADKSSISNGEAFTMTSNATFDQLSAGFLDGNFFGGGPYGQIPNPLDWSYFGGCSDTVLTLRLYDNNLWGNSQVPPTFEDPYLATISVTFLGDPSACSVANHQVSVTYGGTGSGSVDNTSESVVDGNQFTATATADAGSTFDGWDCTPSTFNTTDVEIAFTPTGDVSCVAMFSLNPPATYSVSASIDVSSTSMGSISNEGGNLTAGDTFTSIATANPGYHFDHWDCTPGSYSTDSATLTFTVAEGVSCNAFFAVDAVANHQVSVTYGGTGSGAVDNTSESVVDGNQFTATATADAGSTFDGWDCTPSTFNTTDVEIAFTPTGDVSCVAMFSLNAPVSYTVNWDAAGGTVSPTSVTVTDGTVIAIPTPTRAGYTFEGWTDGEGNPGQGDYTVNGNHTWTAMWAPVIEPVTAPKAIKSVFYFTGDSSKLSANNRYQLGKIAKKLKAFAGAKVVVEGFVFKTPDISRDQKLSLARAKNIVIYLRHLGVKATFTFNARGIAKQHNYKARRAELVATWNLPS